MITAITRLLARLRALFSKPALDADFDTELAQHLEAATEDNIRAGMTPAEARRQARMALGGLDVTRELHRDTRGLPWLENLARDVRFGLRMLRKNPGFTTVAVLTLALGIGSTTAIFSVVNRVLLCALPYEDPDRLVLLWEDPSGKGDARNSVAGGQFGDWREQSTAFESLAAVRRVNLNLTGEHRPERLDGIRVSASYLQILRVRPFLGRGFLPDEDQPGKDKVAVITHQFWQRYFGGDETLVGRTIHLDSESYTVVGVLPAEPPLLFDCDVLLPFTYGTEGWHRSRRDHRLRVVGRLKSDVTLEQARTEMAAITERLKSDYPPWKKDWGVVVAPVHEEITAGVRSSLWVLFGAVGFVLLIGCANVAGLLVARMAARQREMAIRAALGAGRWRVIRQLLTESVLLSLVGGAVGVVLAFGGVELLARFGADILPRADELAVDGRALGFALVVSVATGIVFGLAPALQRVRPNLNNALQRDGRSVGGAPVASLRGGLIVVEVALALMLLTGAGLLLQTLFRLQAVPQGFDAHGVLAMDISLDDKRHPPGNPRAVFLRQVIERIESVPGVEAAAASTTLPMAGWTDNSVRAESRPNQDEFYFPADYDFVSGDFWRALRIPLVRGRTLAAHDDATEAPRTAVLSAVLAAQMFPEEDPLGQRVLFLGGWWEVVGIAGDARHRGPDREVRGHIYLPQAFSNQGCSLVVRAEVPPQSLAETVRKEILALDPDQPVSNIRTLEEVVRRKVGDRRLMFGLLGLFAGVAVLLAAIGLYGVMAYAVSQRTREIGIRTALGARRSDIVFQILRQGLKVTLTGVAVGVGGSFLLTRALAGLLFGVTPNDPLTYAAVIILLAGVAALACWLPARRAVAVDPMTALRSE